MKLKATFIAAIMAVSMSSPAQERAVFGFRVGAQYYQDFCRVFSAPGLSCTGTAAVVNPYVRLHIDGPHNLEMSGKVSISDYRVGDNSGELLMETRSVSLGYEHRPIGGDMAFRVGWHYTEAETDIVAFTTRGTARSSLPDDKTNGFVVGAGVDLWRGTNLAVDWSDWEGLHAYSMLFGFEL